MACAEMSIQAENPRPRGGYDPSSYLAQGVVAIERHQFQLGEMWPLGGSYMTATNAENRTRAWAKSDDSQEGQEGAKTRIVTRARASEAKLPQGNPGTLCQMLKMFKIS